MENQHSSFWSRNRGLVIQGVLLAAVWVFISGKFELAYLFWGAASTALVLWFSHRLRRIPSLDETPTASRNISVSRLMLYLLWLLGQMIRSGIYVAYLVLHPRLPLEPVIVRFTSRQPSLVAKVILGNSITLTPGTLTLAITGDRFVVHALTPDTGEDPFNGEMAAKVCRLYSRDRGEEARCAELSVEERED